MACVDQDQENIFKYHCRICKKGFMCGRALGGHMRAHGIGDESTILDDDDLQSDGEEKIGGTNRSMYRLRTNPNRFKSVRICKNCGKEFLSWKSFLEHGKCGSDEAESLVSSPDSEAGEEDENGGGERATSCGGWSKRKRSLRAKVDSFSTTYENNSSTLDEEEEDLLLARCLIDLANGRVDPYMGVEQQEESSVSASKEEERRNLMARLSPFFNRVSDDKAKYVSNKGLFECKACKKVFNSHQALGGHRASHKKVKGCYAAKQDQIDNYSLAGEDTQEEYFSSSKPSTSMQFEHINNPKKKSKVHECTICHRVFSTGQALGGHKRCHWITSNAPDPNSLRKFQFPDPVEARSNQDDNTKSEEAALDLNLPAQVDDTFGIRRFEVSTEMHLLPLVDQADDKEKVDIVSIPIQYQIETMDVGNENSKNNNNFTTNSNSMNNIGEDEADSKCKIAKLSELKDMNVSCSSPQWLQVGIGSTPNVVTDI
ncbi:hypothetical protein Leryth_014884 [Lithospermum erythrorhizon]|nr:hypothetical protein Leryth_014884 [Lithospermum erythrorhizon]